MVVAAAAAKIDDGVDAAAEAKMLDGVEVGLEAAADANRLAAVVGEVLNIEPVCVVGLPKSVVVWANTDAGAVVAVPKATVVVVIGGEPKTDVG